MNKNWIKVKPGEAFTKTVLATDNLSPVGTRGVFLSNLFVSLTFAVWLGTILLLFTEYFDEVGVPYYIASGVAIGVSLSLLIHFLGVSSTIHSLKYRGSLDMDTAISLPWWVFRSKATRLKYLYSLERLLEGEGGEQTGDAVLVFGTKDNGADFVAQIIHKCDSLKECQKREMHAFGYDEKKDGLIKWVDSAKEEDID